MRAVWSFWSKPFQAQRRHSWPSERHHLFAWVLYVETARRHYPDTWLVTNDGGASVLVDQLGLPFTHVSTTLNALAHHDPEWWALDKIYAYRMQEQPFVHIDSDVFLWKPLPERLERADVFAQNPEPLSWNTSYDPERLEHAIQGTAGGWLPDEWQWYRRARDRRAECCGIFGGNRIDFINRFAEASIPVARRSGASPSCATSAGQTHAHAGDRAVSFGGLCGISQGIGCAALGKRSNRILVYLNGRSLESRLCS
jgi:hypothetical protein